MATSMLKTWFRVLWFILIILQACLCNKCDRSYEGERILKINSEETRKTIIKHICKVDYFPLQLESESARYYNSYPYNIVVAQALNTRVIPAKAFFNSRTDEREFWEINVENQHLEEISSTAFTSVINLREIHLSKNNLTYIMDGTFSIPSLEILDLSMNKIKNFSRFSLTGTSKLKSLNLSSNSLQVFDVISFISAHHITLDLSFNALENFQFDNTAGKIENLNLSHNSITAIKDCFPVLTTINLSNNKLRSLSNLSCFTTIEESSYVNLGSNALSELEAGVFDRMSNLRYLYLDQNNFSSFSTEIFTKLHSLEYLNISHNHLKKFQHGLFEHLENLLSLDVSYNEISDIGSFLHSLSKLKELNVEFNQLSYLDSDKLLTDLPQLKNISFNGNKFSCEGLIEIFRKLKHRHIIIPYGHSKSVDNIHGIRCYDDDTSLLEGDLGSDVLRKVEKTVLQKLAQYGDTAVSNNKSIEEFFNKGFKNSDFYNYLEKLDRDRTYKFNESEFVNYFDKDFKNSTFYRYLEQLKGREIAAGDLNKSFFDFFNKDFKNTTFVKYFENIKNTEEVFNDSFMKSKMFNFFNGDFQNSTFYKFMQHLNVHEGGPSSEKLVSSSNLKRDSSSTITAVFLALIILISGFTAFVNFKMYVNSVKYANNVHEQVELIES